MSGNNEANLSLLLLSLLSKNQFPVLHSMRALVCLQKTRFRGPATVIGPMVSPAHQQNTQELTHNKKSTGLM